MPRCAYCPKPLPPGRKKYCCDKCKSLWHRDHNLPGQVSGIRRLKSGWSVTVRTHDVEGLQIGTRVRLETGQKARHDAS